MTPQNGQFKEAEKGHGGGWMCVIALAVLGWIVTTARAGEPLRVNSLVKSLASNRAPEAASAFEAGRYEVFESDESRLVPRDTNETTDVFVRDTKTGLVERVSMGDHGVQPNGPSRRGFISANGRYVAFESDATNLVKVDTNERCDVFLHDRMNHSTIRISLRGLDGQADRPCKVRGISADGKLVLFESEASNLVMNDSNGACDVFVREWKRDRTRRVSIGSNGAQCDGPSYNAVISLDGRTITFTCNAGHRLASAASHLATSFVRDLRLGSTSPMPLDDFTPTLAQSSRPQPEAPALAIAMAHRNTPPTK